MCLVTTSTGKVEAMSEKHRPDPEFVSKLEWQLKSELRRRQRSQVRSPSQRLVVQGWLKIAALVLLSVSLGAMGAVVAGQIEESWQRQLRTARAATAVEVGQARMDALRAMMGEVERERDAGIIGEETYALSQAELEKARFALQEAELDLEEIETTGRPPRVELFSPALRGPDFVTRRLQLEKDRHLSQLRLIEPFVESVRERHHLGLIGDEELFWNEQEWHRLERAVADAERRLELRRSFLAGDLTAAEIDVRERLLAAQVNLEQAEKNLETAAFQQEKAEERFQHGLGSKMELSQARFESTRAQAEARLARIEFDLLQRQR